MPYRGWTPRRVGALSAGLLAAVLSLTAIQPVSASIGARLGDRATASQPGQRAHAGLEPVTLPTEFRVSTFNVLGDSHTAPGGDRKGWASGTKRMGWAVQLLTEADVDVVGFQEFQVPQYDAFQTLTAGGFGVYPGLDQGRRPVQNSIAWRADTWELVEAHMVQIPYFQGNLQPMPYVLLRNIASGRQVWFVNVHNPADKFGNAKRWRRQATQIESDLSTQLHADGTPVVLTGDMNDREPAFCALTASSPLHAANGGSTATGCTPPVQPAVDWVFGSEDINFLSYVKDQVGLVRRTTDHPFVYAAAHIEPDAAADCPPSPSNDQPQ